MFGRIVVVILILLFVLLHLVGKIMIKKGKLSLGEIFSFLLFPVIFPLGFFIYGYLFASDPYIPKFFSWGANWDVLKLYSVYLAVMLVVQTIMVGVNHTAMIKGSCSRFNRICLTQYSRMGIFQGKDESEYTV